MNKKQQPDFIAGNKQRNRQHAVKKYFLLLALGMLTACSSGNDRQRIGIYVEPLYNSSPLRINVGEYSKRLKSNSPKEMLKLAAEIKNRVDNVDGATLFVLAIRLYDAGEKDEAVYWFYNAQFRKNIFIQMATDIDPTGAPAALQSFKDLSGKWINGYAAGDPDKLVATLLQVVKDVKNMGYIANAYPDFTFKPEGEQQAFVDNQIESYLEAAKYYTENKEEILRIRKENGLEGMY
jgi:hypothetical protein